MRGIIWRNRASAILGLLVIIVPFSGFRSDVRTAILVLLGALIVIFGLSRHRPRDYSYYTSEVAEEEKRESENKSATGKEENSA